MCGFAGIVSWDSRYPVRRQALEAMSAAIAHRGPDGVGLYLNHEGVASAEQPQAGLVHRRLAILDPSERGLQPFEDPRGRQWIVFNGEIYNFRELKAQWDEDGQQWRTSCDTEVLLAAYGRWGKNCCDKLNGMYAFAAWDQAEGTLFLARDRMGQKPLYYAVAPGGGAIAFASELSALRCVEWVDRTLDEEALAAYLCWGYVPSPRTIYRGASKLPPAHWMWMGAGKTETARHFAPNSPPAPAAGDRVAKTRQLVREAVRRRLVADVPLGCFLSGGIDSSIVAAAMRASVPAEQPVLTFSIGFEDKRYDETAYAAAVAKHLGTQHQQFMVRPNAAEDLPKLAQVFGEPFADSSALPTHYLSRETRRHVKVALSGDGGDELFAGYDRYRVLAMTQRWPGWMRGLASRGLWQALPGQHPKSRLFRIKRLLQTLNQPAERRYAGYMRLFDEASLTELWPEGNRASDWLVKIIDELHQSRELVPAALAADRVTYLPEDLLTKVDRASMLHALEVRSPFMDGELVHFAAGLPTDALIGKGKKPLLRQAFARDLPKEVFARPKMGFAVPIGEWFRGELRELLRESVLGRDSFAASHFQRAGLEKLVEEHQQGRIDHSQRLYALLMLELWWKSRS